MLGVGMLTLWAGYALSSWGWILLKGWDICLKEWVSPINPYQWPPPGADVPKIADVNPGSVFPKCGGPATTAATAEGLDTATQTATPSDSALQHDVMGSF